MTDLRKAAEMALKFCEDIGELSGPYPYVDGTTIVGDSRKVSKALRQALAEDALKTVADIDHSIGLFIDSPSVDAVNMSQERVDETAKFGHEWVGLTDEEIYDYADKFLYQHGSNYGIRSFGKAIEAKLKEKNI